jgi:hypothetical protein
MGFIDTTFDNGSLGCCIDEEHRYMWKVMWIADFSESSNFWTHLALAISASLSSWEFFASLGATDVSVAFQGFDILWCWIVKSKCNQLPTEGMGVFHLTKWCMPNQILVVAELAFRLKTTVPIEVD